VPQAEQARNARLSQSCDDMQVRLKEKDEQIASLEDKHAQARDDLESRCRNGTLKVCSGA
jgi:hypothetical protein